MPKRLNMENKKDILKLCRLTYMLIDELVENEIQKEEYLELVDKIVEKNNG